jgi:nucleotide-binding universal stress UspA family protein
MSVVIATTLQDNPVGRARLATRLSGATSVVLLHVVPEDVDALALACAHQDLQAAAAELAAEGVAASVQVEAGTRVDRVLEAASRPGVRMVAVGTPPERIGSTVARLVVRSPVPVLVGGGARVATGGWKVAVALDGSATALGAARWARTIAGAELVGVHACAPGGEAAARGRLQARLGDERGLEDLTLQIAAYGGVGVGEAAQVAAIAAGAGADVLVLGVHQGTHPERLAAGSVLLPLLTDCALPVVAVPDVATQEGLPRLRRVLVPIAFQPASEAAVPWAFSLAGRDGYVVLAHVTSPLEDDEAAIARAEDVERRLAGLIPDAASGTRCACRTLFLHDPVAAVLREAERLAADAIVVGAEAHSALFGFAVGSFVTDLLAASDRPVFVVRPPER